MSPVNTKLNIPNSRHSNSNNFPETLLCDMNYVVAENAPILLKYPGPTFPIVTEI